MNVMLQLSRRINTVFFKIFIRNSATEGTEGVGINLCHANINVIPIKMNSTITTAIVSSTDMDSTNQNQQSDLTSNKVLVQHHEGSSSMKISFKFGVNGRTKYFNLVRNADDLLKTTFDRIKLNVAKAHQNRKSKKKSIGNNNDELAEINLELLQGGTLFDPESVKNMHAWVDGATLRLGRESYIVAKNAPRITKIQLPSPILKGFVTTPSITVENCDISECSFEWFRQVSADERKRMIESNDAVEIVMEKNSYWMKVGDKFAYSPSDKDVAHVLKCVCKPRDHNFQVGASGLVEFGPSKCPFEKRHKLTQNRIDSTDKKFRCVSYNILADTYADSDHSRSVLFAHCPPFAIAVDYRRQLLLNEIEGYNADIICMQEVDKKQYVRVYEPYFKLASHYQGVFHTKAGQVVEGVATFFRKDRFELIEFHRTVLRNLIDPFSKVDTQESHDVVKAEYCDEEANGKQVQDQEYSHPILDDLHSVEAKRLLQSFDTLRSSITRNPLLFQRFIGRQTVLQTSLVKVKGHLDRFLIVANTHLYFAPDADHIRLLQGCVCAKYLENVKEYYKRLIKEKNLAVHEPKLSIIFCGDMNSSPDCGLYSLLHSGNVGPDLKDWGSNQDEKVEGLSFSTDLRFSSAYKDIAYTNYTPAFHGCLDYIYYELDGLELDRNIPLPDHADIIASDGIPSDLFPSDHIALVADLILKR